MTPLPIDAFLPRITRELGQSKALVIVAEPGAGKTTRVPPAILRANLLASDNPRIVMLQPRRVAARASAQRIADENGWNPGEEVGYHIRFEKRIGPRTRLAVVTEGILTHQLLSDPFLEGVGAVILDEFHERSLHVDLAIAMLRELRAAREDLLLIVMSATLDAEPVATFLGDCPIIRVPGRTFPIEIDYWPHAAASVVDRTTAAIERILTDPAQAADSGDVLVFLPGAEEIRRVMYRLESLPIAQAVSILPLHGSLPPEQQTLALRASDRRKIILATNIAETSLTIDGVTTVIDSGLARVPEFDPHRGLDRLDLKRISKASAAQRAGRAGRTAPGRCVRLWSAKEQHALDEFELPEVKRIDLCATVLQLHAWGKSDPRNFGWFESPAEQSLASAEKLLAMLGALDSPTHGSLTSIGKRLMRLPVHPRLARLLIAAADERCVEEGAALAALLSEKDIVRRDPAAAFAPRHPATQADSDLLLRLDLLAKAEQHRFAAYLRSNDIDPIAARQVAQARNELLRISHRHQEHARQSPDEQTLLMLILRAYPDRVCRRRAGDPSAALMVGGGGVRLAPESVVRQAEFFLALDARHDPRNPSREAVVRIASAIDPQWLSDMFPQSVTRTRSVVFDDSRQRVVGLGQARYLDLVISEDRDAAVDDDQASAALAEALRPRAVEIFAANEPAAAFLARVNLLRQAMPEHPWPVFDHSMLGDVLVEICQGKRSVEAVSGAPLVAMLENYLPYPLNRLLREHAPEWIEVPSGSQIQIAYSSGQTPVLAVRLQELFGWTDTPRIAGGRVRLVVHLLGPNYRPVQITDDLASFWKTAYFQVRKDLRVRYPKHAWPDDPLTAPAVAKGTRRRG